MTCRGCAALGRSPSAARVTREGEPETDAALARSGHRLLEVLLNFYAQATSTPPGATLKAGTKVSGKRNSNTLPDPVRVRVRPGDEVAEVVVLTSTEAEIALEAHADACRAEADKSR